MRISTRLSAVHFILNSVLFPCWTDFLLYYTYLVYLFLYVQAGMYSTSTEARRRCAAKKTAKNGKRTNSMTRRPTTRQSMLHANGISPFSVYTVHLESLLNLSHTLNYHCVRSERSEGVRAAGAAPNGFRWEDHISHRSDQTQSWRGWVLCVWELHCGRLTQAGPERPIHIELILLISLSRPHCELYFLLLCACVQCRAGAQRAWLPRFEEGSTRALGDSSSRNLSSFCSSSINQMTLGSNSGGCSEMKPALSVASKSLSLSLTMRFGVTAASASSSESAASSV